MAQKYKTGVYRIINLITGKSYIGGAYSSLEDRKVWHWRALRAGYHFNSYLQQSWNKHGESNFRFEIVETCSKLKVETAEQKWLDLYGAGDKKRTYNLSPFAGKPPSALGLKRSEATKKRMSEALKGNQNCLGFKHSEATKKALSSSAKKRMADPKYLSASLKVLHSSKVKAKVAKVNRERVISQEERHEISKRSRALMTDPTRRMALAECARKQWADPKRRAKAVAGIRKKCKDPEHRAKLSRAAKDRWTEEYREKLRMTNLKPEVRARRSLAITGRPVSEETRAKLRNSLRKSWMLRRRGLNGSTE